MITRKYFSSMLSFGTTVDTNGANGVDEEDTNIKYQDGDLAPPLTPMVSTVLMRKIQISNIKMRTWHHR
ncbi:hypothetical protein QYM36_004267 [Artemia franciscana]|uniref:Uncharacterized protein n=1 Tax=Artemia franciscana TaxID=6661 RepID=A0AA88IEG0_ARTSF|nr:hypothetical protein QYM36_004267 [Artemia franciscana]